MMSLNSSDLNQTSCLVGMLVQPINLFILPKKKSKSHLKGQNNKDPSVIATTTMNLTHLMPIASSDSHRRKCSSFRNRCSTMVKQQKTRIYILRRCVVMLLCWRDHS
ncbi:hypothetical protein LIER_32667 [Lithospermum erythrorhizon]|uniref:Uncharacterized protein n=1 Tax=Lithospermum erythrorhizon TaxID=34254 RepID=A0AAV3RVE3_LITER